MKKFLLVPPNHLASPLTQKLTDLDKQMNDILQRPDLSESSKATMYSQILDKYLNYRRQLQEPQKVPLMDVKNTDDEKQMLKGTVPDFNFDLIAERNRKKAFNLLSYIQERIYLKWNDNGELIDSRGSTIQNSHIVDLINDLVQYKKSPAPLGSNVLIDALKGSNVPHSLIGNKSRLSVQKTVESPSREYYSTPTNVTDSSYIHPSIKERRSLRRRPGYKDSLNKSGLKWYPL